LNKITIMEPEGLIFDCDGTLVDTMPIHFKAWSITTEKYGLIFPEDRFYALGGVSPFEVLRILSSEQDKKIDFEEVTQEKESLYMQLISEAKEIPEVMEIVRSNFEKIPMAVASGGTSETVIGILNHCSIKHYFDVIVTSEDVENPKPAPDTFLEAARRMNIAPEKCRAYEDADMGIKAIIAARMDVVDIRKIITKKS
tara:strand:- start:3884 stop:4477 length:594 start_codon:yes stop_codon:yes gene_type:complete